MDRKGSKQESNSTPEAAAAAGGGYMVDYDVQQHDTEWNDDDHAVQSSSGANEEGMTSPIHAPSASSASASATSTCVEGDGAAKPASPIKRKTRRKKPKDMPKRPLSAYNLFFADERQRLISGEMTADAAHGMSISSSDSDLLSGKPKKRLGFAGLARVVAAKWRTIDPSVKAKYEERAATEQVRYKKQIKDYNEQRNRSLCASGGNLTLQASSNASMADGGVHVWPVNQQTIANLGTMYNNTAPDHSNEQKLAPESTFLDTRLPARPTGTAGTAPISVPQLSFSTATSDSTAQKVADGTNQLFHAPSGISNNPSRQNIGMINWVPVGSAPMAAMMTQQTRAPVAALMNTDPANTFRTSTKIPSPSASASAPGPLLSSRRLSDPEGIQKLATELDDDQLNVLRTFNESDTG
jgi:HMG (high mobility group) box